MFCSGRKEDVVHHHHVEKGHHHHHEGAHAPDEASAKRIKVDPSPPGPPVLPTSSFLDAADAPQKSVLQPNKPHVGFILLRLKKGFDEKKLRQAISFIPVFWPDDNPHPQPQIPGLLQWANNIANAQGIDVLYISVGFSATLWAQLQNNQNMPKYAQEFKDKKSVLPNVKTVFEATGGDLLLHIKANTQGLIEDTVKHFKALIHSEVDSWEEHYTQNQSDFRNKFGFLDGGLDPETSGNPTQDYGPMFNAQVDMGRIATTIIGNEDPNNQHGSYCFTCDFALNMDFTKMTDKQQSLVFGRHKKSGDFIYSPPTMPEKLPNAHTTRMFLPLHPQPGQFFLPLNIFRQPGSYTNSKRTGLYFLAYSRSTEVFEGMLDSMLGNTPQAQSDHLLEWATPLGAQYWYMPSLQQLINIASQNYNPAAVVTKPTTHSRVHAKNVHEHELAHL